MSKDKKRSFLAIVVANSETFSIRAVVLHHQCDWRLKLGRTCLSASLRSGGHNLWEELTIGEAEEVVSKGFMPSWTCPPPKIPSRALLGHLGRTVY